ncbi:hypothetical protein T484DRAFT_1839732 [Baffinella frigidus]|nr:hypothetical protein T484DRAFT_1839732 [Cryptophyta sp. CCMP2293]
MVLVGKVGTAGDSVTLAMQGVDLDTVRVGHVVCDVDSPIPLVTSFLAQILTFDLTATMYINANNEPITVEKLLCTIKKSTGEVLKKKPRLLLKHSTALVQKKPRLLLKHSTALV